ncbi:hypothetical protein VTK56DRAFT_5458 [Thermocarpiscus australiensis]
MGTSETPPANSTTTDAADLTSATPYSLHKAVHARRSEYVRQHRIRIKIGTWNVAACPGTDKDLARWFVDGEGLDATQGPSAPSDTVTDGAQGDQRDVAGPILLAAGDKIGLYVLGLQEVNLLSAPAQYMTWIYAADTAATGKWKAALEAALPDGYQLVAAEQLAGMLLLVYASPEVAPTISNISTATVPAGALGYLGNKGAVAARIVLGETTQVVFVNCHLASGIGQYYVERRVNQAKQVMAQAQFEPISIAGVSEEEKSKIGDVDFAFWFGDFNSRLDHLPGNDIRRLLMLHTRGEYDISKRDLRREDSLEGEAVLVDKLPEGSEEVIARDEQRPSGQSEDKQADAQADDDDSLVLPDPDEFRPDPHEDPGSLQATLDSLLPHDELRRLMKGRKVFHDGWREGPITFLPTYKYDVGSVALFDSSEKRRPPSWCDRIVYRTRRDKEEYERKVQEAEETRRKDEEMKARGMEDAGDDEAVLFSYDPDNDGDDHDQPSSAGLDYDVYDEGEDGGNEVAALEGVDGIHLDTYTSHQRITSSDHKPVSSIFTLEYDAVVPELKAKVQAEVARELDRAENEGRPGITIVADHHETQQHGKPSSPDTVGQVDFGEIRFLKKETCSLTVASTGWVPAAFSFLDRSTSDDPEHDDSPALQWLTTCFVRSEAADDGQELVELGEEVTLEPGETVNVVLEALVDDVASGQVLNDGQARLEDVLVLRVRDGRDHFIPVRASWTPTCVGRSVEELIRVPEGGIRAFAKSLSEQRENPCAIPYDLPVQSAAPKELLRLIEAIETLSQRTIADAQMLENCTIPSDLGWPFDEATCTSTDRDTRTSQIINILDALDQDKPISSAFAAETSSLERFEAVAQCLVLFLRGLTDGVIPAALYHRIEQAAAASIPSLTTGNSTTTSSTPLSTESEAAHDNDRTAVLDILQTAPHHNICFVFLTTALARVVAELAPLTQAELDLVENEAAAAAAAASVRGIGVLGRRTLSFRRGGTAAAASSSAPVAEALAALERRRARERRVAEIFGGLVCRGPMPGREKERRAAEERRRALIELFLRRRGV